MAAPNEICIGNARYRIIDSGTQEGFSQPVELLQSETTTNQKLDEVVNILAGGKAGYAYVEITIPENEQSYELSLGINATQMHVRCDQNVSIKLNSKSGDDINLLSVDFPFTMSELRPNESINKLYFTTGTHTLSGNVYGAIVKVIAIGYT